MTSPADHPATPGPPGGVDEAALVVERDEGVSAPRAVLRVSGELDLATAPLLAARLGALVADGHPVVDVHVGDLHFCDVTGLNVLIDAAQVARGRDGVLTVHDPTASMRRLLAVAGLDVTLESVTADRRAAS